MKAISLVLLSLSATAVWAQSGFSGTASSRDLTVFVQSKLEPPKPDTISFTTGINSLPRNGPLGMRRFLYDRSQHEYAGYDMAAEWLADSGEYRVTFRALSATPEDLHLPDSPSLWRMIPPPAFPVPQRVHPGDTIVLDFFENPSTGQKIVDYLRLERTKTSCEGEGASEAQISCLSSLLTEAKRSLARKIEAIENNSNKSASGSLPQSQQSWERYRDDTCRTLSDRAKQLDCELKLTRNRISELNALY
jgi:uncharacterized protein YecT (DUF1311 family)